MKEVKELPSRKEVEELPSRKEVKELPSLKEEVLKKKARSKKVHQTVMRVSIHPILFEIHVQKSHQHYNPGKIYHLYKL